MRADHIHSVVIARKCFRPCKNSPFPSAPRHTTTCKSPRSYSLPYSLPSLWKFCKRISLNPRFWSGNVTTSTREPPTCAWIRPDIWRQDGAICSKNRKIVPYHRCARILRVTVSIPDYCSRFFHTDFRGLVAVWYHCQRTLSTLFTLKLKWYALFTNEEIDSLRNLQTFSVHRNSLKELETEKSHKKWDSRAVFFHSLHARFFGVSHLARSSTKQRASQQSNISHYLQIYLKVYPLLGWNGWYSSSLPLHHPGSGTVQKLQQAAASTSHFRLACTFYSRLDPVAKEEKQKVKLNYLITVSCPV